MDRNKTKIVATVGPASSDKKVLKALIDAGVNVFRINFSHETHESHAAIIKKIKELNEELGTKVAILADLQGPKLRIGLVENNGVKLEDGAVIEFINQDCVGTAERVYMSYQQFPQDVAAGDTILIDDGKLILEAVETNGVDSVKAKIVHGGILSSKKGVNLPSTKISLPSMTEKDLSDAKFALGQGIDWLALSFVRSAADIKLLKEIIAEENKQTKVIAKIEKPEALEEIDGIINIADGIMVARGDLGVEMPFDQVPLIQKDIVDKCITYAKPVIIATQMLESMITNPSPTRAEANDVANAVLDGASAVMLSGETSVGHDPVAVINAMKRILCYTEKNAYVYNREHFPVVQHDMFIPDSTCLSACKMAQSTEAKAIVVLTYSGYTAFRIASHRPDAKVFAFTPNKDLLKQMSLLWGIKAYGSPEFVSAEKAVDFTMEVLRENGKVEDGDILIHVGSMPLNIKGRTNMMKLTKVEKDSYS